MINIIEGFTKKILIEFGFSVPPKYAVERMKICEGCDQNKDKVCQECGCYLEAKTLVEREKCGLNKWE
jgi:hypothetical protein